MTRQPQRGFTLIELVITLAIGSIILTVGVPAYKTYISTSAVRAAAYDIMTAITLTRSVAIKTAAPATLQPVDGDWGNGYEVVGATGVERRHDTDARVVIDGPSVTYLANGRIAAGAAPVLTVCDSKESTTIKQRVITLDLSGRPNLTQAATCDAPI